MLGMQEMKEDKGVGEELVHEKGDLHTYLPSTVGTRAYA